MLGKRLVGGCGIALGRVRLETICVTIYLDMNLLSS